jgi:predicted MFS family arabinose efflux permease
VGNFLGPLVGGAVAAAVSFRAVFPITALLCLANLALVWRLVPNGRITAPEEDAGETGELEPASVSVH